MIAPAVEHLLRVHAASQTTVAKLPEARRAAAAATGVPRHGSNVFSRAYDKVTGWIGEFFRWLIHLVDLPSIGLGGGGSVLAVIFRLLTYAAIIAAVVAVVFLLARALFGWKPRPRRSKPQEPLGPPPTPFEEARAQRWGSLAAIPAKRLRLLYIALLQELGQRRGWRPLAGTQQLDVRTAARPAVGSRRGAGRVHATVRRPGVRIPAGGRTGRAAGGRAGRHGAGMNASRNSIIIVRVARGTRGRPVDPAAGLDRAGAAVPDVGSWPLRPFRSRCRTAGCAGVRLTTAIAPTLARATESRSSVAPVDVTHDEAASWTAFAARRARRWCMPSIRPDPFTDMLGVRLRPRRAGERCPRPRRFRAGHASWIDLPGRARCHRRRAPSATGSAEAAFDGDPGRQRGGVVLHRPAVAHQPAVHRHRDCRSCCRWRGSRALGRASIATTAARAALSTCSPTCRRSRPCSRSRARWLCCCWWRRCCAGAGPVWPDSGRRSRRRSLARTQPGGALRSRTSRRHVSPRRLRTPSERRIGARAAARTTPTGASARGCRCRLGGNRLARTGTGREEMHVTIQELFQSGREALARVVVGNEEAVDAVLAALVLESHVLIEGPPGTAKTLMVRALARATGLDYARIQFTPDLMPSDLTGTMVFLQNEGRFELRKGPVFASMVLADEINRTPPKTQAALLEAMEEGQVTIEGETLRAAAAVHRVRNREPDRVRGHLPAARGPARPVPVQAAGRLSRPGRRARDRAPPRDRVSARATSTRSRCRGSSIPPSYPALRAQAQAVDGQTSRWSPTSRASRSGCGRARTSCSDPARAARSACCWRLG